MRTALVFIGVFVAALMFGAILAYPVYAGLALFREMEFHRVISRTTLLSGLVFSLLYLKANGLFSASGLGWQVHSGTKTRHFLKAFAGGVLIIVVLGSTLLLLDIYHFDPRRSDVALQTFIVVLLKALLAGCLVALVEEIIFRGALFGGLQKQSTTRIAVFATSFVYAAVHFLKYRAVPADVEIGWLTGPEIFPAALFRFSNPVTIDAFITLFILGLLLVMMRVRSNSILPCIGLHAGIVAALKVFNYLTNYGGGSQYDFLVNKIDHQFGYLASALLLMSMLLYFLFSSAASGKSR